MRLPVVILKAKDWQIFLEPKSVREDFEVAYCEICGWLLEEHDDRLVICLENFYKDSQVRQSLAIPRECVTEMIKLKVTK